MPDRASLSSNPFSTRFIRPDHLAYLHLPGDTPPEVWQRLREAGFNGQIVGPHGVGKTAMLHQLVKFMDEAGIPSRWLTIRPGMQVAPDTLSDEIVTCLEGVELLSAWNRWRILRRARRGCRVIFTTHRPLAKVPVLATLQSRLDIAQSIVANLLAEREAVISEDEVRKTYEKHGGNLREMLLELYDLYENRRGGVA